MSDDWKRNPRSREVAFGSIWPDLRDEAVGMRSRPTPAENRLWQEIRAGRLDGLKFRRQHAVARFIVDFYSVRAALVVEVDGPIHEGQANADQERQAILEAMGLTVLRFTNEDVLTRTETVLKAIRDAAGRRR